MKKAIFIFSLCILSLSGFAQTKEHIYVNGSQCYIIPPSDFKATNIIAGISNKKLESGILFSKTKTSLKNFLASYNADSLKTKGVELLEKKDVDVSNHKGILIKSYQEKNKSYKHILAFEDKGNTIIVNGYYPEKNKQIENDIVKSMMSTIYDEKAIDVIKESDKYTIELDPKLFKLAKNFTESTIYTHNGEMDATTYDKEVAVIGIAKYTRPIADKNDYSKMRAEKTLVLQNQNKYTRKNKNR
ncbi:MAG: hypothetical protein R2831_10320 [Chitinophagaceae bacterium]